MTSTDRVSWAKLNEPQHHILSKIRLNQALVDGLSHTHLATVLPLQGKTLTAADAVLVLQALAAMPSPHLLLQFLILKCEH